MWSIKCCAVAWKHQPGEEKVETPTTILTFCPLIIFSMEINQFSIFLQLRQSYLLEIKTNALTSGLDFISISSQKLIIKRYAPYQMMKLVYYNISIVLHVHTIKSKRLLWKSPMAMFFISKNLIFNFKHFALAYGTDFSLQARNFIFSNLPTDLNL